MFYFVSFGKHMMMMMMMVMMCG